MRRLVRIGPFQALSIIIAILGIAYATKGQDAPDFTLTVFDLETSRSLARPDCNSCVAKIDTGATVTASGRKSLFPPSMVTNWSPNIVVRAANHDPARQRTDHLQAVAKGQWRPGASVGARVDRRHVGLVYEGVLQVRLAAVLQQVQGTVSCSSLRRASALRRTQYLSQLSRQDDLALAVQIHRIDGAKVCTRGDAEPDRDAACQPPGQDRSIPCLAAGLACKSRCSCDDQTVPLRTHVNDVCNVPHLAFMRFPHVVPEPLFTPTNRCVLGRPRHGHDVHVPEPQLTCVDVWRRASHL